MTQSISMDSKGSPLNELLPHLHAEDSEQEHIEDVSVQFRRDHVPDIEYRLFKRRFVGLIGMIFLNIVAAMAWPWFGPISNNVAAEFGITLDEVNWLGNIVACIYLPTALIIPNIVSKYGIRRCCDIGAVALLFSAWIRYAGTAQSLTSRGAYALLMFGQLFAAIAQPIFQVLGPKYSETWFDLKGRTTATMIIAISNPIGGAIGQLLSPIVGDTRQSILILGIMATAVAPFTFLIRNAPPIPPTYAGSQRSPSLKSFLLALAGKPESRSSQMTVRERIDFAIALVVFGVMVAAINTFALLTAQILQPMGYSTDESGFMGACLLLTGIVAAILTAPLFDRVFTHRLAIATKILVPILGVTWLSLIWAVKPHNTAGLFIIVTIIGVCSVTLLPVALELACDLTKAADASSALLWFAGNLFGVVFVLVEGALRADANASPPLNMRRALVFNGAITLSVSGLIFFLEGKQTRKILDEEKLQMRESTLHNG